MLTSQMIDEIERLGYSAKTIQNQLDRFKQDDFYVTLDRPATLKDGIQKLDSTEYTELVTLFEKGVEQSRVTKFVPASGAATRMFKFLSTYYLSENEEERTNAIEETRTFFKLLAHFPFASELKQHATVSEVDIDKKTTNCTETLRYLLTEEGLNYGIRPKALIPFHRYKNGTLTPLEEHLLESELMLTGQKSIHIHYTIPPRSQHHFERIISRYKPVNPETHFAISYSEQDSKTNTIAVDMNNMPFRTEKTDAFLFRPAGHGALIHNLKKHGGDIVCIKNIDNVQIDKHDTILYKKLLIGMLIRTQHAIFNILKEINDSEVRDERLKEILIQMESDFNIQTHIPDGESPHAFVQRKLNRPIRVCGMVRNQGEPGGGPFWVKSPDGSSSLQIVEMAQVDTSNPHQKELTQHSTHFNPVDLICGVRNYQGKLFDLTKYIDHDAVFISEKTHHGQSIKALELPGLWNGAMSDWITLFIEVPLSTFSPVKSVLDLLKEPHQQTPLK